jgi:hypothetical protein
MDPAVSELLGRSRHQLQRRERTFAYSSKLYVWLTIFPTPRATQSISSTLAIAATCCRFSLQAPAALTQETEILPRQEDKSGLQGVEEEPDEVQEQLEEPGQPEVPDFPTTHLTGMPTYGRTCRLHRVEALGVR